MAEPLKNLYTPACIKTIAEAIHREYPSFDQDAFTHHIFNQEWENKELLQRMRHISATLHQYLPNNIARSLEILDHVVADFTGFHYMFFPEYVAMFALEDCALALIYLEKFTPYSSSELAIRHFIIQYPEQTLSQMQKWATSSNEHIRRLASEGCRPRLPWAIALPAFKKDPSEVLKILHLLKHDDSEYVRRSVANNLNDIAKDHPQVTFDIAKQWLGHNKDTDRLVKHACRTLLKQGDLPTLALFGYPPQKHIKVSHFDVQAFVKIGETLTFCFELQSLHGLLGRCRLEFIIYFKKANGRLAPKVFKIAEGNYQTASKKIEKTFSFKAISTRRYYTGEHQLAIILNGIKIAQQTFTLDHK